MTGGAADISKCLDQLSRPLIYKILEETGMPEEMLATYSKILERLTVYTTVAGGLGEAYTKPASTPQGDPMSMMVVAIVMRAWIMQMKVMAVKPRLLADDLQLLSTGARHLEHFEYAFNKTREHLDDMGAKIAPLKCYTCATNSAARKWLGTHQWRRLRRTIPVVNDVRDLGAHWCISGRKVATTSTRSMAETTPSMNRLDMAKAPYEKEVARGKLLPKGLYGCELGPISEIAMRGFRTATANAMTYSTSRRSTDLTFAMCSRGGDVGPDIEVARRRAVDFRRAMVVHEEAEDMVKDIFNKYIEQGHPGTCASGEDPGQCYVANASRMGRRATC